MMFLHIYILAIYIENSIAKKFTIEDMTEELF